jgi:hypothetical protein
MARLKEFKYSKDGVATKREVLALVENDEVIEGIDLGHLDPVEADKVRAAVKAFEDAISPHFRTGFRRFKKSQIVG